MPIIASETFQINVMEEGSITVRLLEGLKLNKCINLSSLGFDKDEMDEVRDTVKQLVGEKAIECDKDTCCISDNYFDFVERLGGLK